MSNFSLVPQFHEIRMTLTEMDSNFREFIGGPDVVDIGETIRVMLADYFYGDKIIPVGQYYTEGDRTIVFPLGRGQTLFGIDLSTAIEVLGEIFWSLADFITKRVMYVNENYEHRPLECFYRFFPMTRELVIYTPVLSGIDYPPLLALDGRAVMTTCNDTLPSFLKNS
jgi:hypothetical protein